MTAAPKLGIDDPAPIEAVLREELVRRGLDTLSALSGGRRRKRSPSSASTISGSVSEGCVCWRADWRVTGKPIRTSPTMRSSSGRDAVYRILALYFEKGAAALGPGFEPLAENVLRDPGPCST